MKKLLSLFVLVCLFSCEKESDNCWRCQIPLDSPNQTTMKSTELKCELNDETVVQYQQANNVECWKQ